MFSDSYLFLGLPDEQESATESPDGNEEETDQEPKEEDSFEQNMKSQQPTNDTSKELTPGKKFNIISLFVW